ncbi:MAG: cation:proton antiporter [Candidatus Bathyarchaeia archaeon]
MANIEMIFMAAGIIISVGFLADFIFKKTGFPDILFLILVGIILGPMLKLFSAEDILSSAPVFSALALMLILFQGGLNLETHSVLSYSFKSATLALTHVILAVLFIPLLSCLIMGLKWLEGLILGAMAVGTSSVVIIPLMLRMKVPEEVRATLSLESTITDALNIILVMVFLDIYFGGFINPQEIISSLIAKFAVGMFLGVIVGAAWIKILGVIKGQEYTYMLTIAALALCYAGTEMLGGSGPLSALVFGITLGNFMMMRNLGINVNAKSMQTLMGKIKSFQDELTFLVRALFFVTLGLIYVPDLTGFIYAAVIMAANLLLRNLAVKFSTQNTMLYKYGRFMTLMCGTGLANATLSIIVYSEMVTRQIAKASLYPLIVTNIIIISNAITSLTPSILRIDTEKGPEKTSIRGIRGRCLEPF